MKKEIDPFRLRQLTKAERQTLKACWQGTASSHQQREALNLVISVFAQVRITPFQPGDPHTTAFLAGRQFCGQALMEAIESPIPDEKTKVTGGKK